MTRVFLSFLALTTGTFGATLTATLKPATVNLGKSATLTLVCEGGIATTVEQTAAAPIWPSRLSTAQNPSTS